jgi:hypothetical protein
MNQRRAVQELNNGGEANGAAILAARITCGKQEQRGAHALPSSAEQVSRDFRDGRKRGVALAREFFFDQDKVVAD